MSRIITLPGLITSDQIAGSNLFNTTGTAVVDTSPYTHAKWDIAYSDITGYWDGMLVCIKVPVLGGGEYGTGFQINSLGYKPVLYSNDDFVGDQFPIGTIIIMRYDSTKASTLYDNSASASTVTGCWQIVNTSTIPSSLPDYGSGDGGYILSVTDSGSGVEWIPNLQSDWEESDTGSDAYILNKPFVTKVRIVNWTLN